MNENHSQLTIRRLSDSDELAVRRLAELDSAEIPAAPLLGAEVEGRLLAAASISDGSSIADPFSRSAELRAVLELRASQLRTRVPRFSGRLLPSPARAAVAAAPAGSGEHVLSLHPRAS
jgi:hypothetical protein